MRNVTINGEEFPLKYVRKALNKVLELVDGKTLKDAAKVDDLPTEKWGMFVFAGLETGCRVSGKVAPVIDAVEDALDNDLTIWSVALEQFLEDLVGDKKPNTEGN